MFWGGQGNSVKIFWVQKKASQLITSVYKCESCRLYLGNSKYYRWPGCILLGGGGVAGVSCFIEQYQGNLQQNFAMLVIIQEINFIYTHTTAVLSYIREV